MPATTIPTATTDTTAVTPIQMLLRHFDSTRWVIALPLHPDHAHVTHSATWVLPGPEWVAKVEHVFE